jgi:hypothetical protein
MFSPKKASFLLSITLLATSYSYLSSQNASITEITQSSSEGITFGTMHSAFKKDVRFENGVDMVVEAAVSLLDSTVDRSKKLGMNPANFFDPVLLGVEESIKTRSKEVGLQKKEEDILYRAVMDALQSRISYHIKNEGMDKIKPIRPQPPVTVVGGPIEEVKNNIEPPQPIPPAPPPPPQPTGNIKPERSGTGLFGGDYYIGTFINVGGSDEGTFYNNQNPVKVDPGTTWGYGVALGVARPDNTRIELEASYRGSNAKAEANTAAGIDISYYSLMANVYRDFEIGPSNNFDAFVGVGLGLSVANMSGTVNNYGVFGHLPETGEVALSYQMILGAKYNYSTDIAFYLAYRLFNTEDFNHYNPDPIHMFEIGLRKDL